MSPAKRRVFALLFCLAGVTATMESMVFMNKLLVKKDEGTGQSLVNFSVPQIKTAPPPADPMRKKAPPRSSGRDLAPLPNLGISNGLGITVDSPDFTGGEAGALNESLLGDLDSVAMTAETVDKPPVVKTGPLVYPEKAKQMRIEGKVVVSVLIGADGRVKTLKILESSPPGVFDQAVQEALPGWIFAPAEYRGKAVQTWASLPLDFSLN